MKITGQLIIFIIAGIIFLLMIVALFFIWGGHIWTSAIIIAKNAIEDALVYCAKLALTR